MDHNHKCPPMQGYAKILDAIFFGLPCAFFINCAFLFWKENVLKNQVHNLSILKIQTKLDVWLCIDKIFLLSKQDKILLSYAMYVWKSGSYLTVNIEIEYFVFLLILPNPISSWILTSFRNWIQSR